MVRTRYRSGLGRDPKRIMRPHNQGAAAALPIDTTGLLLYAKADSGDLLQASGGSPADDDGEAVGAVPCRGSLDLTLTQDTTSAKPTFKTGQKGKLPVLRFDGGDYLEDDTDVAAVRGGNMGAFSFGGWVYPTAAGGGTYRAAFGRNNDYVIYNDNNGNWAFWLRDAANSAWRKAFGGSVQVDAWYHVAAVWTGTDMYIYVNGSREGSTRPTMGGLSTASDKLTWGRRTNSFEWDGDLYDFFLFERAVSNDEMTTLFQETG